MTTRDAPAAPPPNVYAALADRARRMSDLALAACLALGGAGVIALLGTGSGWWKLALPLGAIAAYGLWGIGDRERATATSPRVRDAANAACWIALVAGTAAGAATALALLGTLLGTIIS